MNINQPQAPQQPANQSDQAAPKPLAFAQVVLAVFYGNLMAGAVGGFIALLIANN